MGSRSHLFTEVFEMRQAATSPQVLSAMTSTEQKEKCSPGSLGSISNPLLHEEGKKQNKTKIRQWRRLRSPQPALSRLSSVPEVLLLLSSPLTEGTGSQAASNILAHSSPWQGDWSLWAASSLNPQDTDLDKTKHKAQCKVSRHSICKWHVHEGGKVPCFSLFGPGMQSIDHSEPNSISQQDQSWRLPRANHSLAKPPYAPLQSYPTSHPPFQYLGAPSCRFISSAPKAPLYKQGGLNQIPCPRLFSLNSWWVWLNTSDSPRHGRSVSEALSHRHRQLSSQ